MVFTLYTNFIAHSRECGNPVLQNSGSPLTQGRAENSVELCEGFLHLHHALAAILAREQSDQRLRRVLQSADDVLLHFEFAGFDP